MAVQIAVPDVVGMTLADAKASLQQAGLQLGTVRGQNMPTVLVTSENPSAASQVAPSSTVDLATQVSVPLVVGKSFADALVSLQNADLGLGTVTGTQSAGAVVVAQLPSAGTAVAPGSAVDVTLPVTVPNLVGDSLKDAAAALTKVGLKLGSVTGSGGAGAQVATQNPAAGTLAQPGDAVSLTLVATLSYAVVNFVNCYQRPVSLYAYDMTDGKWLGIGPLLSARGAGGICPGPAAQVATFKPQDGHVYSFAAVDVFLPNCMGQDDPANPNCVCWSSTEILQGSAQGLAKTLTVA